MNRKEIRRRKLRKRFLKGVINLSYSFVSESLFSKEDFFDLKIKKKNGAIGYKPIQMEISGQLDHKSVGFGIMAIAKKLYSDENCLFGKKQNQESNKQKKLIKQYEKQQKNKKEVV